jgi:hypothetical protein
LSRNAQGNVVLCFAEFETPFEATVAINTLQVSQLLLTNQGYRFDKDDILGLQFSYADKQASGLGPKKTI